MKENDLLETLRRIEQRAKHGLHSLASGHASKGTTVLGQIHNEARDAIQRNEDGQPVGERSG